MTCLGAGSGKSGRARGVQFVMGLFGKTQEKPPKELVRADDRGACALGSGAGDGAAALSGWPLFPGPSTRSRGRGKSLGAGWEEERAFAARRPTRVRRASFGTPRPRPPGAEARRSRAPGNHSPLCAVVRAARNLSHAQAPPPSTGLGPPGGPAPDRKAVYVEPGQEPPESAGACSVGSSFAFRYREERLLSVPEAQ